MEERHGVEGARDIDEVLASDPVSRILGRHLTRPAVLAVVVTALVALAILFGPSADSRFIYTDF